MRRTYTKGCSRQRILVNLDHEGSAQLLTLQRALVHRFRLHNPLDHPSLSLWLQEALRRLAVEVEQEPGVLVDAWQSMKNHGPKRTRAV